MILFKKVLRFFVYILYFLQVLFFVYLFFLHSLCNQFKSARPLVHRSCFVQFDWLISWNPLEYHVTHSEIFLEFHNFIQQKLSVKNSRRQGL